MPNKTSQHILGTAANLLGFCLIIISSLHIAERSENNLLDEFASIVAMILTVSCLLSFASIRTENARKERILERTADQLFIMALLGILAIIIFLSFNLWKS